MTLLHFADVHYDQQNADRALASLAVVEETGRREKVDAFALAGDLFERGIQNSAAARLPDLLAAIGRLLDLAPVVAVSGTPTHDVAGCYAPLQAIGGRKHRFTLLAPGGSGLIGGALFLGLPEPSKTWLLAGQNGMSADEAAEAVKLALRKILLAMGAVRAQHPEIPAVLVYHGAVEGATLANGQLLEGGLALGRDDLALVGADYVAMGHVHLRQQIPGIQAWYSGSAFPVDWGELDQKSCNLVQFIEPYDRECNPMVDMVPFPHAPRKKLVITFPGPVEPSEYQGFQTWLVCRATKEQQEQITFTETLLEKTGALPGSRVTVEIIPTETVRAAEITERHHLREKVAVYAEASGEPAPAASVLAKADALEHEAAAAGADAGAHLRIRKLRLRGATGIWKGLGLDEITLDLDRYDAGLVALVGPNGCLSGDTLIDTPRDLSRFPAGIPIRDLVGREPLVYAYDASQGRIVLARARNVRKTGSGRDVLRVHYTSAQHCGRFSPPLELIGTADHPVMLLDGTYRALGNLRPGDSLMPLYRRIRDGKYVWINLNDGRFALEHRMVAEAHCGRPLANSEHSHHRDRNPINNSEENVEAIDGSEHGVLHGRLRPPHCDEHPRGMLGKSHSAETVERIRMTMRSRWSDPGERARRTESNREAGLRLRIPCPDADLLRDLYIGQGLPTTALAGRLGVSDVTVAAWLRECGIPVRHPGGRSPSTASLNHRVLSVEPAGREDVYDMEVPEFENFVANGVVVHNSGKSTLLENMHPWPCLLTRDGKLQDHFRLRDSARELWFVDERTGREYRALMLIDGVNSTGKAEYHLFRADEPLTNGRKEDYEAAVERLFGTLALFLRSAFVSQRATKNNPDLAEATKGEKKAIFRELAGLDWLEAAAESAKLNADRIEHAMELDLAKTSARAQQLEALPDLRETLTLTAEDLVTRELELVAVEERGKTAAAKVKDLAAEKERQAATERAIAETLEQQKTASAEATKATMAILAMRSALEARPAAEASLADYEALRVEKGEEDERAKAHAELVARAQSEYANALRAHRDHDAEIQKRHAAAQKAMVALEGDRRVVLAQIDRLIADIETPEKACPNCGYIDPERKTIREGWKATLVDAQEKAHGLAQDIEGKRREAEAIDAERAAPPEAPKLPAFDGAPLAALKAKLAAIDPVRLRTIVDTAKDAAARIAELEKVAADADRNAAARAAGVDKLRGQIDPTLGPRAADAQAAYDEARREYVAANEARATLAEQVKMHRKRIAELEAIAAELAEAQQQQVRQQAEAAEWRYLERACGADGIQALELDALGPGIAEVANRLLSAAYGSRFTVEFRTTRIAGRGSRVKQVEDFAIVVHDAEHGSEQDLSTLSGGEGVWVRRAIVDSFGIVRERGTGLRFLTVFQDEADGALDPAARLAYFAMLRAAHAESGRRHTIVITHSTDAQEAIPQRIVMAEIGEGAKV